MEREWKDVKSCESMRNNYGLCKKKRGKGKARGAWKKRTLGFWWAWAKLGFWWILMFEFLGNLIYFIWIQIKLCVQSSGYGHCTPLPRFPTLKHYSYNKQRETLQSLASHAANSVEPLRFDQIISHHKCHHVVIIMLWTDAFKVHRIHIQMYQTSITNSFVGVWRTGSICTSGVFFFVAFVCQSVYQKNIEQLQPFAPLALIQGFAASAWSVSFRLRRAVDMSNRQGMTQGIDKKGTMGRFASRLVLWDQCMTKCHQSNFQDVSSLRLIWNGNLVDAIWRFAKLSGSSLHPLPWHATTSPECQRCNMMQQWAPTTNQKKYCLARKFFQLSGWWWL